MDDDDNDDDYYHDGDEDDYHCVDERVAGESQHGHCDYCDCCYKVDDIVIDSVGS